MNCIISLIISWWDAVAGSEEIFLRSLELLIFPVPVDQYGKMSKANAFRFHTLW